MDRFQKLKHVTEAVRREKKDKRIHFARGMRSSKCEKVSKEKRHH